MVLAWLLRLVLLFVVVRAVWRFLLGVANGMSAPPQNARQRGASSVPLVQDPVCGTYIVPSRALTLGHGESLQHFCSERCRDLYRAKRAMPA